MNLKRIGMIILSSALLFSTACNPATLLKDLLKTESGSQEVLDDEDADDKNNASGSVSDAGNDGDLISSDNPEDFDDGGIDPEENENGEYSLMYELDYAYSKVDDTKYYPSGRVVPPFGDEYESREWCNLERPFVYVMFFPEMNGAPLCVINYDFLTEGLDDEVASESPYDEPNGTKDAYNTGDGKYDSFNKYFSGPLEVSGVGTGTLTVDGGQMDMVFVFKLIEDSRKTK